MIPGLERSPEEEKGYPLQYSWTSLVSQVVKNPPAIRETWVPSLGWEGPLEEGKATRSVLSQCLENPVHRVVRGVTQSQTRLGKCSG